jgi:hypothetical protein
MPMEEAQAILGEPPHGIRGLGMAMWADWEGQEGSITIYFDPSFPIQFCSETGDYSFGGAPVESGEFRVRESLARRDLQWLGLPQPPASETIPD